MKTYQSKIFRALFIFFVFACNTNKDRYNEIIVKGTIHEKLHRKIYLFDVSKPDLPIDSTDVIDGKFSFKYNADSSFSPHRVMLCIRDSFGIYGYLKPIGFKNPFKSKTIESVFFLDKGVTSIDQDSTQDKFFSIHGSRQDIPMYQHIAFHILNNQDTFLRQQELKEDITKINKYSYSYYLADLLYKNREIYTKQEFKLLLSHFSDEIGQSLLFKKCESYLLAKDSANKLNNFFLETAQQKRESVIDTSANYNLLIFWASWCAPCRREIPELKKIFLNYHDKGLSLSSISIDNNFASWKEALDIEKMPWNQFIINDSIKNELDAELNLSSIPLIVLLNKNGHIIVKETGFDEKSSPSLIDIIREHIN